MPTGADKNVFALAAYFVELFLLFKKVLKPKIFCVMLPSFKKVSRGQYYELRTENPRVGGSNPQSR